jgi:hypothetical protein
MSSKVSHTHTHTNITLTTPDLRVALLTKYRAGDQIKKNEMDGARSTCREMRGAYPVLVGKPEEKRKHGRPWRKWKDNIKMDVQEVGWGTWTGLIWLRTGTGEGLLRMR